jgi:hypothetical protein
MKNNLTSDERMIAALDDIVNTCDKAAELIYVRNRPKADAASKAHYCHNIRLRNKALNALDRDLETCGSHFNYDPMKD